VSTTTELLSSAGTPGTASRGIGFAVRGLAKSFGPTRVLEAIDLEVAAGEFVAIVGHSGCGKSTLLRLVAGLERPTQGEVRLGSDDRRAGPGDVRVMFQEPRLLPWKSVLANVLIGLPAERRPEAVRLLEEVGLTEKAEDWPNRLSGGQKQRVALARALASTPGLLLLDEPLGALDALTRIEMQRLIGDLWLEKRFTALLVTHDVAEAVSLATRVIYLEGGRIALDLAIPLAFPRERSGDFAHFERRILDRILGRGRGPEDVVQI
jgi:sulfonate transport system ATP-binding protein